MPMLKCIVPDCPTPAHIGNYCADCWNGRFPALRRAPRRWPRTQDGRFVFAALTGFGLLGLVVSVVSRQPGRVFVVMSVVAGGVLGLGAMVWGFNRVFDWILQGDVR